MGSLHVKFEGKSTVPACMVATVMHNAGPKCCLNCARNAKNPPLAALLGNSSALRGQNSLFRMIRSLKRQPVANF
jgi:hypothetical protein